MRIGDSVWYAKRIENPNAEIPKYEKPIEIVTRTNYLTIMPASSRGGLEVLKFGEAIFNTWTGIANARYFNGEFKEGDLFWVDGHKPIEAIESKYGNGASANAVIKSALPVNLTINLILSENQERIKR